MSEENKNDFDDFESLLNSFINTKIEDFDDIEESADTVNDKKQESTPIVGLDQLSAEEKKENEDISRQIDDELSTAFAEARTAIEEDENKPTLGTDESELAQAFMNYQTCVQNLSRKNLNKDFECSFSIDDLYPNYKPSLGIYISNDLIEGWQILSKIFPDEVGKFPISSSDEEFLNFAETLTDSDLQLAVISYVEILIDMESCELTYLAKLAKYQEKHIKKIMYEEYMARKERQYRFTEAVKKKGFPIDAERLISNYFKTAQKDVDGAYKALTSNPAMFAPIDFSRIKPRFFGLIKVTPKDGIRINAELADFLKKLKA